MKLVTKYILRSFLFALAVVAMSYLALPVSPGSPYSSALSSGIVGNSALAATCSHKHCGHSGGPTCVHDNSSNFNCVVTTFCQSVAC